MNVSLSNLCPTGAWHAAKSGSGVISRDRVSYPKVLRRRFRDEAANGNAVDKAGFWPSKTLNVSRSLLDALGCVSVQLCLQANAD